MKLTFNVPVTIRQVRLYNPRQGDEAQSSLKVLGTQVVLFADAGATQQVCVRGDSEHHGMSGTFYGQNVAIIAEIEVIARAEAP